METASLRYWRALEFETESAMSGDFSGVDDLLDFSNEESGAAAAAAAAAAVPETTDATGFPMTSATEVNISSASQASYITATLQLDDICVPCEDLAQLEWLSNFVEESFSSPSVFNPEAMASHAQGDRKTTDRKPEFSASPVSVLESSACSEPPGSRALPSAAAVLVPGRGRSKRAGRTGVCFWNTRILSTTDTAAGILESASASTATAPPSPELHGGGCSPPAAKKPRQGAARGGRKGGQEGPDCRRCLHCGIQKTPQWRAGPMGPKTLCNACGVRYKSGRLLPEYRPAASPTFVGAVHSNSHRKVLELRKQRAMEESCEELVGEGDEAQPLPSPSPSP